eukprot:scaffold1741_cov262-Pinguiococcus_pyrenoidosus.AAC.50
MTSATGPAGRIHSERTESDRPRGTLVRRPRLRARGCDHQQLADLHGAPARNWRSNRGSGCSPTAVHWAGRCQGPPGILQNDGPRGQEVARASPAPGRLRIGSSQYGMDYVIELRARPTSDVPSGFLQAFGVDESRRRIYALVESDHPFEIGVSRTGSVVSVGYESFGGNLFHAVSAHAKYDSKAQEWLLAGYDLSSKSRDAAFSVVSKEGTLQRTMNFTLPWKTFMHDWAATATRGIFIVTSSQVGSSF